MHPEDQFDFAPVEREPFDVPLFLAGVITGAAVGAGIALLFAPQSGPESRRDIAEAGAALRDRVTTGYASTAEHTAEALGAARERVTGTVSGARGAVESWLAQTKQTLDDTRQRLDAAVEAGRETYAETKTELDAQVDASLDA